MMKNRIMQLAVKDGVPVVPGAVDVQYQLEHEGRKFFIAYGAPVKGTAHKTQRGPDQVVAYLWEWEKDNFAVFADEAAFATIDPTSSGKPMTEWKKTPANLAQWPTGEGWRKGASTSPTAEPTIPASCGPVDLVNNLDTAKAEIVTP